MSTPKSSVMYHTIYEDLIRAVTESGRAASVQVPDSKTATKLRLKYYSWRQALAKHEELAAVRAMALGIVVQIEERHDGFFVYFTPV